MQTVIPPGELEVQCWYCEVVYPAKGYERRDDWLCDDCFRRACVSGHAITQMAEDIARQLVEVDWYTRTTTVLNLLNIRSAIVRAERQQAEEERLGLADDLPF